MARRDGGVYSSSAIGTLGRMVIAPPDTLTSSSCPLLNPACRRAAGETTIDLLFLTATVILMVERVTVGNFHLHDNRYTPTVKLRHSPQPSVGDSHSPE